MILWQEWWRYDKKFQKWKPGEKKNNKKGKKKFFLEIQIMGVGISCPSSSCSSYSDSRTTIYLSISLEIKELQGNPVLWQTGTSALLRVVKRGINCLWEVPKRAEWGCGELKEDLGPKHVVVEISSAKLGLNEQLLAWNILYFTIVYVFQDFQSLTCRLFVTEIPTLYWFNTKSDPEIYFIFFFNPEVYISHLAKTASNFI